jgi:hypothetical protein
VTSPAAFYTTHVKNLTMRDVAIRVEEEESPIGLGIINYGSELYADNIRADKGGKAIEVLQQRETP